MTARMRRAAKSSCVTFVTFDLHPAVERHVRRMLRSGLYGFTIGDVVEGLFLTGLRAELGMPR